MWKHISDIREFYGENTAIINSVYNKYKPGWVDPYSRNIDWVSIMTPIEFETWQAIRAFGKAPFYPQFPVGKRVLDFGNPSVKVGIECDGKDFHMDVEKDIKRDEELHKHGWRIYRISGKECFNFPEGYYDLNRQNDNPNKVDAILREYYLHTPEGLITSLAVYYFGYVLYSDEEDDVEYIRECLDNRISLKKIKHRYL